MRQGIYLLASYNAIQERCSGTPRYNESILCMYIIYICIYIYILVISNWIVSNT